MPSTLQAAAIGILIQDRYYLILLLSWWLTMDTLPVASVLATYRTLAGVDTIPVLFQIAEVTHGYLHSIHATQLFVWH